MNRTLEWIAAIVMLLAIVGAVVLVAIGHESLMTTTIIGSLSMFGALAAMAALDLVVMWRDNRRNIR